MTQARLIPVEVPDRPTGAVLVLHGGASRRDGVAVSPAQLSVLRMIPIAARIARGRPRPAGGLPRAELIARLGRAAHADGRRRLGA